MYKEIGHVIKPHGLKGEVVVLIDASVVNSFNDLSTVYLDMKGTKVPYLLQKISPLRPGQFKLRLAGVESLEEAEALRKLSILCLRDAITEEEDVELSGYTLYNENVEVGIITSTINNSLQILLEVKTEAGEKYIPLSSDWVLEVDAENKRLVMSLPDGLLDI